MTTMIDGPYRVLKRLAYQGKDAVPRFRWCVVDWRGQTVFIGDVNDHATADAECARLNGAEVTA